MLKEFGIEIGKMVLAVLIGNAICKGTEKAVDWVATRKAAQEAAAE
jgi:hypothetical protein